MTFAPYLELSKKRNSLGPRSHTLGRLLNGSPIGMTENSRIWGQKGSPDKKVGREKKKERAKKISIQKHFVRVYLD